MRKPNTDTIAQSMQVIKLFPNPASDKLILEWQSDSTEKGQLTIEDMLGRTLFTKAASSNTSPQSIDVSKLAEGTYIVWLKEYGHAIYQTKVVIIK